jgi:hypothetical protein
MPSNVNGTRSTGLRRRSLWLLGVGCFFLWLSGGFNPLTFAGGAFQYSQLKLIRDLAFLATGSVALVLGVLGGRRDLLHLHEMHRGRSKDRWRLEWGIVGAYSRVALTKDQIDQALQDYLNCIVRECHKRSGDLVSSLGESYFWTKIYRCHENGMLEAAYTSSSAPPTAPVYNLSVGVGGAGRHAQWAIRGIKKKVLPVRARLYTLDEMTHGLTEKQRKALMGTGIKTVLCAAIFPQLLVIEQERLALKTVALPGQKFPKLLGIVCFCSTLAPDESSLQDEDKHVACELAAQVAGVMMTEQS